jgi:hypothetical protein
MDAIEGYLSKKLMQVTKGSYSGIVSNFLITPSSGFFLYSNTAA